jgi:hypothetical protein
LQCYSLQAVGTAALGQQSPSTDWRGSRCRSPKLLQNTIARVGAEVTATDIDTIRKDLSIGDDRVARGVVDGILVGEGRRMTLSAYRSTGVMTHRGSAGGLTIAVGETLNVEITLLPVTGAIGVTGTISTGGQGSSGHTTGETRTFDLPKGATMEFVWIEPGTFTMGSPHSESGRNPTHEGEQRAVTISRGFWLGKHELTQGQWEAVMGTEPWSGSSYAQSNVGCPAVHISWDDMQGLIQQLNQAAGDSLYRLPTEAEWGVRLPGGDDDALVIRG